MRRVALPLLLLAACGGTAVQVSPCGLSLIGASDTFDVAACDAVRTVATVYGADLTERVASRFAVVVSPASLVDDNAGETFCESRRLVLADSDWYPSAICHELFHAVTCDYDSGNPGHVGWVENGAFAAIERFHGLRRQQ